MLTIHRSNSLASLADALAEVQRAAPLPPLTAEPVIVQSLGMKRWLSFALAGRLGVAANIAFHFPAGFVAQLFAAVLPGEKPSPVFDREVLPWRVLAILPEILTRPGFEPLAAYVAGENRDLKLFQLAAQIARTFDRYLAWRPQLLLDWQRAGEGWQPALWREIANDEPHMPQLAERFRCRARESAGALPPRFSIFGAASLGPFFLDALAEAARHTEAHLFLLTPTPEYWGDIASAKTIARLRQKNPAAAAHREQGHPLLASFAKVGRDFFDAVAAIEGAHERDYFTAPAGVTALTQIQRDIFDLHDRTEKIPLPATDQSIRLHAAHSPLREIEILHDHLLAWFERGIAPRDVLVMMPDVETYAPFIEAVFSTPEREAERIPFSIADRAASRDNIVAQAFLALIALAGSRLTAPGVLALLDLAPVRARFGIAECDLPLVRDWAARAGIRWGRDAAHRESCGVPAFAENSWRHGLDRLLLGFALPGDGATLFEGILPEPVAEGSAAKTLGAFAVFADSLFKNLAALEAPRTAADWTFTLRALLEAFIAPDDIFADDRREVSTHLGAIAENAAAAAHDEPLAFAIIRAHLADALSGTDRAGTGFLSGRVTFCSMKPMRSIPHRVIALLGLDGDKFPRRDTPPQFDLIAADPRPGDRAVRDDDRQIFIESLLAARDALHLSHVGLSQRDNAPLPPSTVVAELLAHLDAAFTAPDGQKPSALVTVAHPLQAFSPRAFSAPRFSYSRENARACAIASAPRTPRGPLIATPLPAQEIARELSLEQLTACLTHPAKFFARAQSIRLPNEEPEADDTEPLALNSLENYVLKNTLTEAALASAATNETALRATGKLPPAYPGLDTLRTASAEARRFARRVQTLAPAPPLPPLEVTATIADWRITATFRDLSATGLVFARPATLKAKDFLRAWLAHLVLCAAAPAGIAPRTLVIGTLPKSGPGDFEFAAPADPAALLRDILEFYTAAHSQPQRLLPECALAFAEAAEDKDPLDAAENEWSNDNGFTRTESDDEWNAFFFSHEDPHPLDATFRALAEKIIRPLLAHRLAPEKTKSTKRK